ncbi:hypothetical protein Q8791_26875 [Nocardiopsis sp. CT-R113]|uniref:Secreted protein n=1 Tax=Nocardiopsis codii TaxID=3065942 RepID=A0ABU7KF40_9ACTN|nr:hypothetical protein [Nocardiopsis sp. CT-R113]MEE2040848.1 hypothetical protein [Nocardiopsis sp. CT-R113]
MRGSTVRWALFCVLGGVRVGLNRLLARRAPQIRAEETPVRLYEGRYLHNRVDSRLLVACDDHGIEVDAPEEAVEPIRKSGRQARKSRNVPAPGC